MLTIGGEIEFGSSLSYDGYPNSIISKWELQREYYSWQIEFNDFLTSVEPNKTQIKRALRDFRNSIIQCGKDLRQYARKINLQGWLIQVADSFVFNGLHLHFSVPKMNAPAVLIDDLRVALTWLKMNNTPTIRAICSHHVWGYYRSSEYSFKQKAKYKPLTYTRHHTWEIRIIDYMDLEETWLADFLQASYKALMEGENIYELLDIDPKEAQELFRRLVFLNQDYTSNDEDFRNLEDLIQDLEVEEKTGEKLEYLGGGEGRATTKSYSVSQAGRVYRRFTNYHIDIR